MAAGNLRMIGPMLQRVLIILGVLSGLGAFAQKADFFVCFSLSRQAIDAIAVNSFLAQAGAYNLLGSSTVRLTVGTGITSSNFLEIALDIAEPLPIAKTNFVPYLGGGLGYIRAAGTNFIGVRGVAGVDYNFDKDYALMAEFVPVVYLVNGGAAFGWQIRLGANRLF